MNEFVGARDRETTDPIARRRIDDRDSTARVVASTGDARAGHPSSPVVTRRPLTPRIQTNAPSVRPSRVCVRWVFLVYSMR